jgi:hypothetical protein
MAHKIMVKYDNLPVAKKEQLQNYLEWDWINTTKNKPSISFCHHKQQKLLQAGKALNIDIEDDD